MWLSVVKACRPTRLPLSTGLQRSLYSGAYDSAKDRLFCSQLGGNGSIDLTKNEETGIATLVMNRPEMKNALNGPMLVAFSDAIGELESWSTGRGVIVYGSDHTFCSGGDLNMAKQLNPNDAERISRFGQNCLNRLYQLPLVTVALVEGRALGGGAEVACACDFRSMSTSAAIGFVQTKMSISPAWGAGARLVEILGRTKALQVLASGTVLATDEALKIGLADVAVPDGQLAVEETLAFLRTFTVGTTKATQAAKKVVVNASPLDLERAVKGEKEIFKTVWGSPEHLQALDKATKFKTAS